MNPSRLWIAASIIACVIFISFILFVPRTRDVAVPLQNEIVQHTVPTVDIHDTFKKGVHTITGSIMAPNACTLVTAEATLVESASSTASILVTVSMPEDVGICLQLPTTMRFSTTLAAPANLPITANVNGVTATTTEL